MNSERLARLDRFAFARFLQADSRTSSSGTAATVAGAIIIITIIMITSV